MSERLVVLSTVADGEQAERMGRALVERRLAACVNVLPGIVSIYRWRGAVERGQEWLLLIKTRAERLDELRQAVLEMHPYELPEVVALPIAGGHRPYLQWLDESVEGA